MKCLADMPYFPGKPAASLRFSLAFCFFSACLPLIWERVVLERNHTDGWGQNPASITGGLRLNVACRKPRKTFL